MGRSRVLALLVSVISLLAFPAWAPQAAARDIVGAATVAGNGLLRVGTQWVQLFGIYIPPTGTNCETVLRPARCGSRAAIALEFKIQGFVRCSTTGETVAEVVTAICYVRRTFRSEGVDLGAYLLSQGWALALPDAPFEYYAREEIARSRGVGLWGFSVDSLTFD
jgi:endonuclease YncB( thermonuclease family)